MKNSPYQIGGSLPEDSPTYVIRKADDELYQSLKSGDFCYVLNSRQMGKSSLLVRTMQKLQADGFACATIDLSDIGSKSLDQWYGGFAYKILSNFNLFNPLDFMNWWEERELISPVQKLGDLIAELLLKIPENIIIFIDEIDSVLSLKESMDDFFALIRSCYNKRSQNPAYKRLTFALLGVATPTDLISDSNRTPFNIGKAIELMGFKLEESQPLLLGLAPIVDDPETVIKEILYWTGGQPFLTQKLCNLVREYWLEIPSIKKIVQIYVLDNWESQDEPTHLKTIRDRLLRNPQKAGRFLGLYQQILQSPLSWDDSLEQTELRLSGLVIKQDGKLTVSNSIYAAIFNQNWVEKTLLNLRPYGESLTAWLNSNFQDESRLLRGKALAEALLWSNGKNLTNQDYQFLSACQDLALNELKEIETQNQEEIARLYREKELLAALNEEQEKRKLTESKLRREKEIRLEIIFRSIAAITGISAFVIGFFFIKSGIDKFNTKLNSLSLLSEALLAENKPEEALIISIKAAKELKTAIDVNSAVKMRILLSLYQAVNKVNSFRDLLGHEKTITSVSFSPNNQLLATVSDDQTMKIWDIKNQRLNQIFEGISDKLTAVKFNFDGSIIAAGTATGMINIFDLNLKQRHKFTAHKGAITSIRFNPANSQMTSAGIDGKIKIWNVKNGELIKEINGHTEPIRNITFSADGKTLVSAGDDHTLKLWNSSDGTLIKTLNGHRNKINYVRFSANGKIIASASSDRTVKLWDKEGNLLSILTGTDIFNSVSFSPDNQTLAAVSNDGKISFWDVDGTALKTIQVDTKPLRTISISSDGENIAFGGDSSKIILWRLNFDQLLQSGCNYLKNHNYRAYKKDNLCDN
jgi:AAA-like domain/WD domain, G-beta repeat